MKYCISTLLILATLNVYSFTRAFEAPLKNCNDKTQYSDFKKCFAERSEANHAFTMLKRDESGKVIKTKYVAVLLHGLSDSPYFYRDIAQILFEEGINVFAYRHTGHGSHFDDLKKVKKSQWYEDLDWAKSKARSYGDQIILGGMSLGGALATRDALMNPSTIGGLMLFSGVVNMILKVRLTCLFKDEYQADKTYGEGVRYPKISNNASCEVFKITQDIKRLGGFKGFSGAFNRIEFPLFNVLSVYDSVVNLKTLYLLSKKGASKSHLLLYTGDGATDIEGESLKRSLFPNYTQVVEIDELAHASVLLKDSDNDLTPETNKRFDALERELRYFIKKRYK